MIFIIGVGRSGTSLLQSILNSHTKISFLPETQFIRKYIFKNSLKRGSNNYQYAIKKLKNDSKFKRLNISYEDVIVDSENMFDVYQNILKIYLKNKNKNIIGDKDPKIIEYIPILKKYFPSSKIIHIIRDPRDVVLSRTKAQWSKRIPYFIHSLVYFLQINYGIKMLNKLYKNNHYEIIYENLLKNPKYELTKLMNFIGVDYESQLLDFKQSSKELVAPDEFEWKKETFNPIIDNNFNKWIKELSLFKILIIESITYLFMLKKSYKPRINIYSIKIILVILLQPLLFTISILYRIKLFLIK